jgi:hypothetical protein
MQVRTPLRPAPIEGRHGAIRLAFYGLFFQVVAFVDRRFPATYTDLHFDTAVFPVKPESDQSLALNSTCRKEFRDLRLVQQKLPWTLRFMLRMARAFVWLNIGVVQKDFAVLDSRKRVVQVRQAGSNRFDLGAAEFNPCLDLVEDLVIVKRSAIRNDLRGHGDRERRKKAAKLSRAFRTGTRT